MNSVLFFCVFSIFLLCAGGMELNHSLTSDDKLCELSYGYNTSSDTFHFELRVYSTGWIALAMTLEEGARDMKNYDIALGGVNSNSTPYLNDYWSSQKTKPTLDTKQDFVLVSGDESNGWTTLHFYRKADTKDSNGQDIKIEKGKAVYFAWARNAQDADSPTSFLKHGDKASKGRGYSATVGFDLFTGKEIETPSTSNYLVASTVLVVITTVLQYFM